MNKNIFRSIGAVLAGLVTIILLSAITDTILEASGVFPTMEEQQRSGFNDGWLQILALTYRFIYTLLGGYLTAKLAPASPVVHVIVLAVIGTTVGILGLIAVASLGIFPLWFSIAVIVISFPALWLGGKLGVNGRRVPAV